MLQNLLSSASPTNPSPTKFFLGLLFLYFLWFNPASLAHTMQDTWSTADKCIRYEIYPTKYFAFTIPIIHLLYIQPGSPFTWPLKLFESGQEFHGSGVATSYTGCTEIRLSISQHINTVEDQSLKNRTPLSILLKGNSVQSSSGLRNVVKIIHHGRGVSIFN